MTVLKLLFSTGPYRSLTGVLAHIVNFCAACVAAWVIYSTTIGKGDLFAMTITFLSVMMALLFLLYGATSASHPARPSILDFIFAGSSLAAGIYFTVNSEAIINRISLMDVLSQYDILFGSTIFFLTMEATRRTIGMSLTVVVLVFVAYNLFGHYLGGAVGHGLITYRHFLDLMVFTTDGIFGVPVRVAATYVFLFVLFGTFLTRCGGSEFFFNFAAALTGRKAGGPAKVAVISSGLYGTISGSPTSDVVVTGSVTIPMMKRLGYPAALAGGVEITASTAGGILPPVMGSAAFIMAEYTGISYRDIALAATIPSLLYFVGVYTQVHLRSLRMGLVGMDEKDIPKLGPILRQGMPFYVPLLVLIIALLAGYSPTYVAVFATLGVIAVFTFYVPLLVMIIGLLMGYQPSDVIIYAAVSAVAISALFKTHFRLKDYYSILAETTLLSLSVTAACAAAGLVVGGLSMTGLATKFSSLVFLLTDANVLLSLLVGGAITILLGMGMPTPSVYILGAVLVGPVFVNLGIPMMAAHMFILYYACLSAITPPVAVAAFAASAIARTNPLDIAMAAVRLSIVTFVVPFVFIYSQGLLLIGSPFAIVLDTAAATAAAILMATAVEGYSKGQIAWWGRGLLLAAAFCLFVPRLNFAMVPLGATLATVAFLLARGMRARWVPANKPQNVRPRAKTAKE